MKERWQQALLAGTVVVVAAAALGEVFLGLARAVLAVVFITVGITKARRDSGSARRPWTTLCVGGGIVLAAAVFRTAESVLTDTTYPFPSVADLMVYAGYSGMIAGGGLFVRARTRERKVEDLLDSFIAVLLTSLMIYFYVLNSYLQDSSLPLLDRLTNLGYSVLVVALVGVSARVSFGPGERNGAYYLLASSTFAIVINDTLALLDIVGNSWAGQLASVAGTSAFVFATASVAHPGAMKLADQPEHRDTRLSRRRIVMLFAALILGPALLAGQLNSLTDLDLVVVLAGTGSLAVCVLLRMVYLVRSREERADRERALRELGTELVRARESADILKSGLDVVGRITDELQGVTSAIFARVDRRLVPVAHPEAEARRFLEIDQEKMYPEVLASLGSGASVSLEEVPPLAGLPRHADQFVVTVPVSRPGKPGMFLIVSSAAVVPRETTAALRSVGDQISLALDSLELREQLHQRRSNRGFQALVENSSDVVLVVDESGLVGFVSPTVERLLGRPEEDVLGIDAAELLHRPDQLQLRRLLASPGRAGASTPSIQVRLRHGSGELRWFEIEASDLRDEGEVQGIVITASDVNDRKRAEAQLLRSEARFRLMVQNSSDVVAIVDENAIISYVSPSIYKMLGFSPVEVLGRNVFELLSITEAERLRSAPMANLSGSTVEVRIQGTDGQVHAVEVAITDMREQPEVDGIVLNMRDVTERKTLEDDLRHQALHDDLTGLPNRALFAERVKSAVGASTRTGKLINDSLGHVVGDQVLVGIADRVQQTLRLSDMAARLGGDEFAVLLTGIYGESEITEVAERVREAIAQPIVIGDGEFELTASIGIAIAGGDHQPSDDLLRSADLAMYRAKHGGKNRFEIFEDYMEASVVEQLELKTALKRAVEHDEFVLHYQPIVDMSTSRICGVEALIRWDDPNRGLISPASFIPVAEETGLINEIGMWVAKTAAGDLARWRASGHDLYCSVNVSGRQMSEEDFGADFIGAIDASGVDPTAIVIELTESVLAVPGTSELFDAFHTKGFRIALDDFGTGYSALQYLQTFDIDLIKIDRSFVTALGATKDTSMVKAVLDVAASIHAQTVAEGIEDTGELHLLKDLGVDLGQGYYFSRPVPEAQLLEILANDASPIAVS